MNLEDYVRTHLSRGDRGSFVTSLADTWCRADSANRHALQNTFPDIFKVPQPEKLKRRFLVIIDRPVWMRETYTVVVPDDVPDSEVKAACIEAAARDDSPGWVIDATPSEYLDSILSMEPFITVEPR